MTYLQNKSLLNKELDIEYISKLAAKFSISSIVSLA